MEDFKNPGIEFDLNASDISDVIRMMLAKESQDYAIVSRRYDLHPLTVKKALSGSDINCCISLLRRVSAVKKISVKLIAVLDE